MARNKTGIVELDEMLRGGFMDKDAVMVAGSAGTGKTTLALEYLVNGATQFGEPGIYLTFEQLPDQLYRDAENFGWNLRKLETENKLRVVCTSPDLLLDHEDQGPNLQASSDCLQVRSGVSASRPEMLFVGNRFGGDAKDLGQQLMVVADALVHPVNLLGWIVESVCSSHFEDSHVSSTCWSDEFDIGIPDTWLADHERIRRRGHRSLSDVWLKVVDRSADKVDIVSPSSHNWVGRDAGMAILREVV